MEKTCIICGKVFNAKGVRITCSDECSLKRRRQTQRNHALSTGKFTLKKKKCKVCGKEFETYRSKQVCCSEECSYKNHLNQTDDYHNRNKEKFDELKRVRERERYRNKVGITEGAVQICSRCGKEFPRNHKRKYCDECKKVINKEYNTAYQRNKRANSK